MVNANEQPINNENPISDADRNCLRDQIGEFTRSQHYIILVSFMALGYLWAVPDFTFKIGLVILGLYGVSLGLVAYSNYIIHRYGATLKLLNDPIEALKSKWSLNGPFVLVLNSVCLIAATCIALDSIFTSANLIRSQNNSSLIIVLNIAGIIDVASITLFLASFFISKAWKE